jgi:hypothetical protein
MVTAALLNTHVRDNLNFLFSGDAWVNVNVTPGFQNGWTDYDTLGGYGPIRYQRRGGFVCVAGLGRPAVSTTPAGLPAFTLPAGYRPADIITMPAIFYDGGYQASELHIYNDGQIIPRHAMVSGGWMSFALSFQYVLDF